MRHLNHTDCSITVDNVAAIEPAHVVRDLGVCFDSELTMHPHIRNVTRTCFYHLRRLRSIRRHLGRDITHQLVCSFVLSRLDYCNALFAALPTSTLAPLQRVQNAAARLVLGLKQSDHITPALKELHWLPIKQRILYKLSILVYKSLHHEAPVYLTELFNYISDNAVSHLCVLQTTINWMTRLQFGERSLSVAGARQWNSLPADIRTINDFKLFKSMLKTHLFKAAYNICS